MACRFGLGSVTYAMVAEDILSRHGIRAKVVKLKAGESPKGCAYGIEIEANDCKKAFAAMKKNGISFKELK